MRILLFVILASTSWANNETYNIYYAQDMCKSGHNMLLLSAPEEGKNSTGMLQGSSSAPYLLMNCTVILKAPPGYKVVVSLARVNLRFKLIGACIDFIKINSEPFCLDMVYPQEFHSFLSLDSTISITFNTSNTTQPPVPSSSHGFLLSFTAAKKGPNCTQGDLFACVPEEDGTQLCIWNHLTCDGHNNCHNNSDEWETSGATCNPKNYVILIVLLFLIAIVLGIAIAAYVIIRRRRMRPFYEAIL